MNLPVIAEPGVYQ